MASGQQKRFNWGQVGVSALSAGAGSAITGGPFGQMVGAAAGEWAAIAASAMAGSALTQSASSVLGIGHFNWTAVAAAGAGAMLGHSVGKGLHAAGLRQPLLSGTLKSMASGGAQSLVHGVRPNWGRIAAESFGNNVGHQVVGSAVERDREQQQQRQPQAIRREVAGQNDAVGYRDDGGLQARAETAWRQQERRRQTAIAEVQSLERAADVSLNGEAMLDEIVVTASRLPPGDEPSAMQRARDAYSEALKDTLIGTGQILSDQMYFMASRASGGLIDDRGAAARNVELVRGTMGAIAGIPRQFAVGMYYLAHPGELNAEQIGRAMGGAAAGSVGGRVVAGLRGKGAVGYAGGVGEPSTEVRALTAAERSANYQGVAPYKGVDRLRNIQLNEGKRVAHVTFREDGRPISEYFTTESAIRRATLPDGSIDANRLNQGLQIYAGKDPISGLQRSDFKSVVQFFETTDVILAGQVAFGRATANPVLNPGGYPALPQLFINEEFHQFLRPLEFQRMTNTSTPFYLWPRER